MLYSYKTITLNLLVYVLVVGGTDARACAASTVLTLFTVATLALYMRLGKNKDRSDEMPLEVMFDDVDAEEIRELEELMREF